MLTLKTLILRVHRPFCTYDTRDRGKVYFRRFSALTSPDNPILNPAPKLVGSTQKPAHTKVTSPLRLWVSKKVSM